MKNLEKDHTYLIRYGASDRVSSITILTITDTSYQLRWNNNINNPITWELKETLHMDYSLVEDITKFDFDKSIEYKFTHESIEFPPFKFPTYKFATCPECGGTGVVPDNSSSSGTKICPRCWGSKMMLDYVEP